MNMISQAIKNKLELLSIEELAAFEDIIDNKGNKTAMFRILIKLPNDSMLKIKEILRMFKKEVTL